MPANRHLSRFSTDATPTPLQLKTNRKLTPRGRWRRTSAPSVCHPAPRFTWVRSLSGPLPSQTLAGPGLRPNFRDLAIQAPPLASLTTPATGIALLDSGNRSNRRAPCVASSLGSPLAPAPTTASLPTGPAAPPPSANAEPATTPAAAEDLLDPRRVPAHTRTGVGAPGDPFLCSRGR